MFKGSITALVTPFKDGAIDETAYQDLIEWQIAEGTHGLVPCGTTGESPTLNFDEHKRVTELCIEAVAGRVPVLAGTGSNNTIEAIELTQHAKAAGASAALIAMPYYNKPTQEGLYRHYQAIHDAVEIPIVIYNIPGRSVVDMTVKTMARLAELPNIVAVKDATADLARPLATRLALGEDFCQLSGEDATVVAFLAQGGHGCISVSSNCAPGLCSTLHEAWMAGDMAQVGEIRDRLMPLHSAMFCEASPGPAKYALELLGRCRSEMRLPLCEISDASKATVRAALEEVGLL